MGVKRKLLHDTSPSVLQARFFCVAKASFRSVGRLKADSPVVKKNKFSHAKGFPTLAFGIRTKVFFGRRRQQVALGYIKPLPCVYEVVGIGAGCLTYRTTATVRL